MASVSFRSTEAFADYLQVDAAMTALREESLLAMTKKQRGMIGETRARDSMRAQMHARGLQNMPMDRLPSCNVVCNIHHS